MFILKLIPVAAVAAIALLLPNHAAAQGSCAGKASVITIENSSTPMGATSKVEYFAKVKNLGGSGQRYVIQFTYGLRPMQEKVDGTSRLMARTG